MCEGIVTCCLYDSGSLYIIVAFANIISESSFNQPKTSKLTPSSVTSTRKRHTRYTSNARRAHRKKIEQLAELEPVDIVVLAQCARDGAALARRLCKDAHRLHRSRAPVPDVSINLISFYGAAPRSSLICH